MGPIEKDGRRRVRIEEKVQVRRRVMDDSKSMVNNEGYQENVAQLVHRF